MTPNGLSLDSQYQINNLSLFQFQMAHNIIFQLRKRWCKRQSLQVRRKKKLTQCSKCIHLFMIVNEYNRKRKAISPKTEESISTHIHSFHFYTIQLFPTVYLYHNLKILSTTIQRIWPYNKTDPIKKMWCHHLKKENREEIINKHTNLISLLVTNTRARNRS